MDVNAQFNFPVCNLPVRAEQVISVGVATATTTTYGENVRMVTKKSTELTPRPQPTLEAALADARSPNFSKLTAVLDELDRIWSNNGYNDGEFTSVVPKLPKVLIFSQYQGFLDLLDSALKRRGDIQISRLDGKMTLKERMVSFGRLSSECLSSHSQEPQQHQSQKSVFLASMKEGGRCWN